MLIDAAEILMADLKHLDISRRSSNLTILARVKQLVGLSDVEAFCLYLLMQKYNCEIKKGRGEDFILEYSDGFKEKLKELCKCKGSKLLSCALSLYDKRYKDALFLFNDINLQEVKSRWMPYDVTLDALTCTKFSVRENKVRFKTTGKDIRVTFETRPACLNEY